MTVRYVCFWQHQSTSKKLKASNDLHMEFGLNMTKLTTSNKLPLFQLLTVCSPNWTIRTQRKFTAEFCYDKVGQFIKISASQKSARYSVPVR